MRDLESASPRSLRAANLLAGFAMNDSMRGAKAGVHKLALGGASSPKPVRRRSRLVTVEYASDTECEPVKWEDPAAGTASAATDAAASAAAAAATAAVQEAMVTVQREQDNLVSREGYGKRTRKISQEPAPPRHKRVCAVQNVQTSPPFPTVQIPQEQIKPPSPQASPPQMPQMQPRLPHLSQLPQLQQLQQLQQLPFSQFQQVWPRTHACTPA